VNLLHNLPVHPEGEKPSLSAASIAVKAGGAGGMSCFVENHSALPKLAFIVPGDVDEDPRFVFNRTQGKLICLLCC
jgi:hypothetical protein